MCAADTRMSTGYSIMTRDYKKIEKMSDRCVMASAGFMADAATLKKTLKARCVTDEFQNDKPMGCVSFAQMLSNTLYYRRFFPYYTFNIVAGLDATAAAPLSTGTPPRRRRRGRKSTRKPRATRRTKGEYLLR